MQKSTATKKNWEENVENSVTAKFRAESVLDAKLSKTFASQSQLSVQGVLLNPSLVMGDWGDCFFSHITFA